MKCPRLPIQAITSALCAATMVLCATPTTGAGEADRTGRVEGVLRIGANPAAGLTVILERNDPPSTRPTRRTESPRTQTNADGGFVFDNVEPGEYRVGLFRQYAIRNKGGYTPMATPSHAVAFRLKPAQTVRVQIGGTGRPVVGKVVPPKDQNVKLAYQGGSFRRVWLKTPPTPCPEGLSRDKRAEWLRKWYGTEAGLVAWRARRSYVIDVEPDGSFRIEDVPAGSYQGQIEVAREGSGQRRPAGWAKLSFTVPPMPGGRSDKPLDLGEVPVTLHKGVAAGQQAPGFEVRTLNGKSFKLADYRGKVVLIDFWATWCGPCKRETPHLKAVWDRFGKDPRFAMIGLSLDRSPAAPKAYASEKKLGWIHALLTGDTRNEVTKAYGVRSIPSIFLIGPDGKIIATGLRGERIASAVEEALRQSQKQDGKTKKPGF